MSLIFISYMILILQNGYTFQRLNLRERNLTSTYQISTTYPLNIIHIDLSYNEIEILEAGNLYLFTSLSSLIINTNKIKCIKNGTFNRLNRLTYLGLKNNYLTKLENFIFNGLFSMIQLFLGSNQIELIEKNAFYGLNNLANLDMERNKIKSFAGVNMSHMLTLKRLGLSFNKLTAINMSVFDRFVSLETLYINYNPINVMTGETRINRLRFLRLENLILKIIIKNLFLDMKNPIEIDLNNQRIKNIESDAFGGMITRIILDRNLINRIDHNSFGYLPILEYLSFNGNNIDIFSHKYFKFDLPSLKTLSLESNYIKELNTDFGIMFRNLTFLDLSNNRIKTINKIFKSLSKLEKIYLSNNAISNIEKGTFLNQIDLKELYLDSNFISNLDKHLFESLSNLEILSLSNNKIHDTVNNSFYGLSNLKNLQLDNNYLKSIIFNRINKLEELYLSGNLIEIIDLSTFNNYENLRVLDLSNNMIKSIPQNLFLYAKTLESFSISNNNLDNFNLCNYNSSYLIALYLNNIKAEIKINKNLCLDNFINLEIIDLSNNFVEFDNTKLFTTNKRINEIYLSNINLTDIKFIDFEGLKFSKLDLSHNLNMKYKILNMLENGILNYYVDEIKLKKNTLGRIFISILNEFQSYSFRIGYDIIDLSDNNIEWLPEITFWVKFLDLSNNNIKNINGNGGIQFSNVKIYLNLMQSIAIDLNPRLDCYYVEECIFSYNNLKHFPSISVKIKVLDVGHNRVKEIKSSYLLDYKNLDYLLNMERLLLNNNEIYYIEPSSFEGIPNVKYLSLEFNHLNDLNDVYLFNNLFKLEYLSLGNNNMSFIRSFQFNNLDRLKLLDLSFNNIHLVQVYSFVSLSYLNSLYLQGNKNMILENEWIYELERTKNIYISEEILSSLSNIEVLKETIRPNKIDERMGIGYYDTIYLTSYDYEMEDYNCILALIFIISNIPYNLKDDLDLINFISNCFSLSLKF